MIGIYVGNTITRVSVYCRTDDLLIASTGGGDDCDRVSKCSLY